MRLRFAPSPTGPLHLGGLRTALYNHILARAAPPADAEWILRIEDTDQSRTVPSSLDDIRTSLDWAGIHPDKGPIFQSHRLPLYKQYADRLLNTGHAYRCFCSPDTLAQTRERLAKAGSSASYDRRCAHLTEEDVMRRVKLGHNFVVRFDVARAPTRREQAHDLVFGTVRDAHASLATDPIILKTDSFPTYHLASVVDDHEMGITHVLRGEEWLASLPLHLDLYAALGVKNVPLFAHLPILLNKDGSKMSKRHGDVRVGEFRERGWESEAVVNWLVLAGWGKDHKDKNTTSTTPDSTEIMSLPDIISRFSLDALTHRNSILDALKLEYINKHHLVLKMSTPEGLNALAERVLPQLKAALGDRMEEGTDSVEYVGKAISILRGRLVNLFELAKVGGYLFVPPSPISPSSSPSPSPSTLPESTSQTILTTLLSTLSSIPASSWETTNFSTLLHQHLDQINSTIAEGQAKVKMGPYMKVLRDKLAGVKDGPAVADLVRVLGRERVLKRLAA